MMGARWLGALRPGARSRMLSSAAPSREKTFFLETHGCQMNASDSEIVRAILTRAGWAETSAVDDARVLLTNTCSVREKAENKVRTRLSQWRARGGDRRLGVLGCMATRLREELTESRAADLVAGPDSYRHLPALLDALDGGAPHAIHTQLSLDETYADIAPVRALADPSAATPVRSPSALVTIMRGCNNMCSYCVVPFTRGRERSRELGTIVDEVRELVAQGVREVTLLGQNVNSYHDRGTEAGGGGGGGGGYETAAGFGNVFKARHGAGARFAELLEAVAAVSPELRVRFTSPHPKDFPPRVLELIGSTPNICSQLHLPAQSGSSSVLDRMRREYTREAYLELVRSARGTIPGVTISTDVIAGFCGETEAEHAQTVALMREVAFDQAFMYAYSWRSKTHAARRMADDVPAETKRRRLQEIIDAFHAGVHEKNRKDEVGAHRVVLVEGGARRAPGALTGRTDGNKRVVFTVPPGERTPAVGEYAVVHIAEATGHTLRGACITGTAERGDGAQAAAAAPLTSLQACMAYAHAANERPRGVSTGCTRLHDHGGARANIIGVTGVSSQQL